MKKIVLSICNSLMAMSITHSLTQTGGFQIVSTRPGCKEIARECADASADVLLMEAAFNIGAPLDDCLKEAKRLRSLRPDMPGRMHQHREGIGGSRDGTAINQGL